MAKPTLTKLAELAELAELAIEKLVFINTKCIVFVTKTSRINELKHFQIALGPKCTRSECEEGHGLAVQFLHITNTLKDTRRRHCSGVRTLPTLHTV